MCPLETMDTEPHGEHTKQPFALNVGQVPPDMTPAWMQLGTQLAAERRCTDADAVHDAHVATAPSPKKRRLSRKTTLSEEPQKHRLSYAASWEAYLDGNVVSETSHRYILNLLAATAATKTE